MFVIKPGYQYALNFKHMPNDTKSYLVLQFHETAPVMGAEGQHTGEIRDVAKGTTDEDVLDSLINRAQYLNAEFPTSPESERYLYHLTEARKALDDRTADRVSRGVKGKFAK